jgi:fatty acid CoA ligase FadD21
VAAIAVADDNAASDEQTEKLVTIVELKDADDTAALSVVKDNVIAAISRAHGLQVADIVLVEPGSIPTTTSGKIRRSACAQQHRQGRFVRLDA